MAKKSRKSDSVAVTPAVDWRGLRTASGEIDYRRARTIRNDVTLLQNRAIFSRGAAGDRIAFLKSMTCSILRLLMEKTEAPRRGLAPILGVHVTSVGIVLDDKKWPTEANDVPLFFFRACLWMFLGEEYGRFESVKAAEQNVKEMLKSFGDNAEAAAQFLVAQYALNLREYFFPQLDGPADGQDDAISTASASPPKWATSPYFDPLRRDWTCPFDDEEMGTVVQWLRRLTKSRRDRIAYIAFFVPTATAAENIFRNETLVNNITLGPRDTNGRFRVDVFYPNRIGQDSDNSRRLEKLSASLNAIGNRESQKRQAGPVENPNTEFVRFRHDNTEKSNHAYCSIRGITSFMYVGHSCGNAADEEQTEWLYLVRHNLDERRSPICLPFTKVELAIFAEDARRRYDDFDARLKWFKSYGISDPS